jgi:hypothetical protein
MLYAKEALKLMAREVGFNFIITTSQQFCTVCWTAPRVQLSLALIYFGLRSSVSGLATRSLHSARCLYQSLSAILPIRARMQPARHEKSPHLSSYIPLPFVFRAFPSLSFFCHEFLQIGEDVLALSLLPHLKISFVENSHTVSRYKRSRILAQNYCHYCHYYYYYHHYGSMCFSLAFATFQLLNPIQIRKVSLEGGSARHKAAFYNQGNTNTE